MPYFILTLMPPMHRYLAEFTGTLLLVFLTTGVDVLVAKSVGVLGIGLSYGFAYAGLYYGIASASGSHLNPALTLACWLRRTLPGRSALGYAVAQVLGAAAGAGILWLIVRSAAEPYDLATYGFAQNGWGPNYAGAYRLPGAALSEVVGTFTLVATYLATRSSLRGIAVGALLAATHWVGLYVTGASFNPAHSLAAALVVGQEAWSQLWLFIVAPAAGGALAALYDWIRNAPGDSTPAR